MSETTSEAPASEMTPAESIQELGKQLEAEGHIETPEENTEDIGDDAEDEDEGEKITLKVNGKSIQKSMSEVIELAQKYSATEMKLETAKKEITEARALQEKYTNQSNAVKELIGVMQKGDIDTIHEFVDEKLGASQAFNKGVIDYVLKLWEQSKWTPQQREAEENKKLLGKMRAQEEQRTKQDAERAHQYQVNQWTQHIDVEVPKALREIGLPDNEFIRGHVISTWKAALENEQNPTALAVANYVKQQLEAAKINFGGQPVRQPVSNVQSRPRATTESVNRKSAEPKETGYIGWDQWQKTRGR